MIIPDIDGGPVMEARDDWFDALEENYDEGFNEGFYTGVFVSVIAGVIFLSIVSTAVWFLW